MDIDKFAPRLSFFLGNRYESLHGDSQDEGAAHVVGGY